MSTKMERETYCASCQQSENCEESSTQNRRFVFLSLRNDVFNLKQAGCFGFIHSTHTLKNEKHSVRHSCLDDEIVPAHTNEVFFYLFKIQLLLTVIK